MTKLHRAAKFAFIFSLGRKEKEYGTLKEKNK